MEQAFLEGLDLGEGAKLPKEAIAAILAEHTKTVHTKDNTITTLTTERDGLQTQLTEADKAIQSYKEMDVDGIKAKVGEWETKYNTDTQALKDQIATTEYGFAVKEAASAYQFTSESARKAFVADLTAKKLPVQEGKLLGLEDFAKAYKEADPGAFAPEKPLPQIILGGGHKPVLSNITREEYVKMGYSARLKLKTEQPALYQELTANS